MKRLYIGLAAIALLGYSASSMSSSRSAVAGKLTGLMNRNMSAMTAEQYYAWKQEVDSLLNRLQGSERAGFERRIPGLQARLSDIEVNSILADGKDAYDKIDNMPTNTPEEKAAQAQAYIQWFATDPGIDFVGKKQTYNDAEYRKLLTEILAISTYPFITNSKWIDAYTNATTDVQEGMRSTLLSGLSYPYTTAKLIIKRLDPSVISQLISSERDSQMRSDISKALTIARNIRSEQEAKNYALNKINELNATPQAMESDADKVAKQEIVNFVKTGYQNLINKYTGKTGWFGRGEYDYSKTVAVIKDNANTLETLFLKYDYQGVINQLNRISGASFATVYINDICAYTRDIAINLMIKYASDATKYSFLADKITALKSISTAANSIILGKKPTEATVGEYAEQKEAEMKELETMQQAAEEATRQAEEATRQAEEAAREAEEAAEEAARNARYEQAVESGFGGV